MTAKFVKATSENRVQLGEIVPMKVPFTFAIYPTNVCNFKCFYCSQSQKHDELKAEFLPVELYKKAVDDISNEFSEKMKLVVIAGVGEPLCHPDIGEMVKYTKEKNIAETVRIISNGSLLTKKLSDELIEAGLDSLKISIQGLNDQAYFDWCKTNIKFDRIVENIRYYYENKRSGKVEIKIMSDALKSEDDKRIYFETFQDICDTITIENITALQDMEYENIPVHQFQSIVSKEESEICQFPFYIMALHHSGEIMPCCITVLDSNKISELFLGSVKEKNIAKMWKGKEYHEFRMRQLKKEIENYSYCQKCTTYKQLVRKGDNIDDYKDRIIARIEKELRELEGE